jgi:hypothetical protein
VKRGEVRRYDCRSGVGDVLEVAAVRGELMFHTSVSGYGVDGLGVRIFLSRDQVCALIAQLGLWLHTSEK